MVQGATYLVPVNIDVNLNYVDSIIFTLKCGETKVQKEYPSQTNFLKNGNIGIPLNQYETTVLQGLVKIEAQINYKEGRVAKTETDVLQISPTLATKFIDGSESTEPDLDPLLLNTSDPVVAVSGATFIPSVSEDGVISWTNDGDLKNPTPVNIKGPKGDKGDKGDQGTPGQRGEKGEKGDQGIPGEKGAKGDKGDKGDTGAQGIQGVKGDPGEQGIQGVPGAKGDKGDPGEPGAKGDKGDPGDTPYIGENGNWFIGDTDTETSASGTPNAVQYVPQTLTSDQQTQARRNIDTQSQVYAVKRANPWSAEDCANDPVRGLKLYGACEQDGTPTPENPIEVKCNDLTYFLKGKNLVDMSEAGEKTIYGVAAKYIPDDNCIILNGTASSNAVFYFNKFNIHLKIGTKVISSIQKISGTSNGTIYYTVAEGTDEDRSNLNIITFPGSDVVSEKNMTKNILNTCFINVTSGTKVDNLKIRISIQVFKYENNFGYYDGGSITAPSLYGIGDVQDEWDAMTGHGVRRINKIIMNGTENITLVTSDMKENTNRFYFLPEKRSAGNYNQRNCISNCFPSMKSGDKISDDKLLCALSGENGLITFRLPKEISNSELAKTFIEKKFQNGNPIIFFYELKNSEDFTNTPAQLITPDGYAQFLPSGDGVAGDIEAEYAVDIEKRYVPKETYTALEERVAALELVAIEG